ncbi:MAG: hypothetical protein ACFB5Z_19170 [Elainellaceae cyanobacterium]
MASKTELPLDRATRLISALDEAVQKKYLLALADSLRFDPNFVPPAAQPAAAQGDEAEAVVDGEAAEAAEGEAAADEGDSEAAGETPDESVDEAPSAAADPDEAIAASTPPDVMSAQAISAAHGIDLDDLDAYGIVVRRKQIKSFVGHYGRRIKSSDVTKLFKTEAYERFFGKSISRCGNQTKRSATVYGYAEVLQRVGVIEQVKPPRDLRELFVKNDVEIPGSGS